MAWLDYSAINMGYRELNNKPSVLKKLQQENNVEFLNANILLQGSNKPLFTPYLIKELEAKKTKQKIPFKKIKIGILGLCDNKLAQMVLSREGEPTLVYQEPVQAAKQYIDDLKKKSDLVILLYYGRYEQMKTVVDQVPGIDLVVMGGETYRVGRNPQETETIITVTSQAMGKYAGVLNLSLNKQKKIASFSTKQVPLNEDIADDPKFARLVQEYESAARNPRTQ
ncbi:hypothetical protein JXO59_01310 [candidate division KSB1 bacterium]|nr:hypothetical protein [candidate division KSB1 bacterium]